VVTEDVPAHMIAAGNPARVIKPVPREQAGSTGKAS
jgi:acetyltransferase-like isoleucine patch superfamily enzyme